MFAVRLSFSCLFLFLLPYAVFAQAVKSQAITADAFSTLLSEAENNPGKRAEITANWARRQPLSSLSWQAQVGLLPLLEAPDRVDKKNMSVRWTGKISVPSDGQYTFEQLCTYGTMKLWLNENLVLGSAGIESPEDELSSNKDTFRSIPVALQAGIPADFRLEYVYEADASATMEFPVAVLLWESEAMEQQIVPKGVFRQPVEKKPGLRGEYFADANFARKIGDRVDDAVEFIWDRDSVFNAYNGLKRQIVKTVLPRIANGTFLAGLSDDDAAELAKGLVPLLSATTASERVALVEAVSSQPRLLKEIPLKALADQIQVVFMLPNQIHLDFIVRWSEVGEVPSFEPGTLISGRGTYADNNINPYWRIGQCIRKSDTQELYNITGQHLQNEDGSCNLGLTYIVVSAARNHNRLGRVLLRIDEALADKEISGDAKASWYLAKSFALETAMQPTIKPGRGLPELHQALGLTESDEFRSRVQQELAARLLTLGRDEEAKSILPMQNSEGGTVSAQGFQEQYKTAALRRAALVRQHYINSVKKHQETARLKNDTAQVIRLQNAVSDFESKQQSEKK